MKTTWPPDNLCEALLAAIDDFVARHGEQEHKEVISALLGCAVEIAEQTGIRVPKSRFLEVSAPLWEDDLSE